MADGVRRFYLDGRASCLLDLFGVGEARRVFQDGLAERVGYVMRELARVVAETGVDQAEADVRAEDALIAIQGSLVVSRALDDPAPFLRVVEELPDRLLAGR